MMCQQCLAGCKHSERGSRKSVVQNCSWSLFDIAAESSLSSAPCLPDAASAVISTCAQSSGYKAIHQLYDPDFNGREAWKHTLTCISPASGLVREGTARTACTPARTKVLPSRADAEPWHEPITSHEIVGCRKSVHCRPSGRGACARLSPAGVVNAAIGVTMRKSTSCGIEFSPLQDALTQARPDTLCKRRHRGERSNCDHSLLYDTAAVASTIVHNAILNLGCVSALCLWI